MPLRYLETLWDELHPSGSVEVFLARVDGSDVAGNMVTLFSGTVTGRLLGFDPLRLSRRLRPNEALIWAIINWAVEHGATTLDVGGVARAAAEEGTTASSAQQMKMRLGGDVILYPGALELIPNLALRSGFGLLRSSQLVRRVGDRLRASSAATARR